MKLEETLNKILPGKYLYSALLAMVIASGANLVYTSFAIGGLAEMKTEYCKTPHIAYSQGTSRSTGKPYVCVNQPHTVYIQDHADELAGFNSLAGGVICGLASLGLLMKVGFEFEDECN